VIYADECWLWVYSGATGAVRLALPHTSFTGTEASLVADVDGDGNADAVGDPTPDQHPHELGDAFPVQHPDPRSVGVGDADRPDHNEHPDSQRDRHPDRVTDAIGNCFRHANTVKHSTAGRPAVGTHRNEQPGVA